MIIFLLLAIICILFPPFLIVAIPIGLLLMVKSGVGSFGRGVKEIQEARQMFKENIEANRKAKEEYKKYRATSKQYAENRTEEDNKNIDRLKAEIAKDKEMSKAKRKAEKEAKLEAIREKNRQIKLAREERKKNRKH